MWNRFTGVKKPQETPKEEAPYDFSGINQHIQTLNTKEQEIYSKIQQLDNEIMICKQQMQAGGPNYNFMKSKCMNLIKRRKLYENQLKTYGNMNLTMNQTQTTIDSIQMMQEQYKVMKEVVNTQNKLFSSVNIDDFVSLSDKMQDMREDMDDVQEMLADAMVGDVEVDEDELERELAMYAVESLPSASMASTTVPTNATPAVPAIPQMPSVNIDDELSRL